MPLYDFTCQDCEHTWSELQKYDDPAPKCPECKSKDTLRHFPCPAVHIFYSPAHPRHKRGMVNQRPPKVTPVLREKKEKKKRARKT
jgi:putative FmdB family regulatory protein